MTQHTSRIPIHRQNGITPSEKYLAKLCENSFLSLWSYPGLFKSLNKELCDVLVVFKNHVIIFSDKDISFGPLDNLQLAWARWFRRAVLESSHQIFQCERWIRSYPGQIFLDAKCTQRFPLQIPNPNEMKCHRIVVAHGIAEHCRRILGGSGTLMFKTDVLGEDHYNYPFTIGQVAPTKGYVHVLNDSSLQIVMGALDTVSDFVSYFEKKEQFLTGGKLLSAAGEEELLAIYLKRMNAQGEHDFIISEESGLVSVAEGFWEEFCGNPQRKAQIQANEISYAWDSLIETFSKHILDNTQYYCSDGGFEDQEMIVRFMAAEPRTKRRLLAKVLRDIIITTPPDVRRIKLLTPTRPGEPYYIFLLLPHPEGVSSEDYREFRHHHIEACCLVAKLLNPDAIDIVGIAMESGMSPNRSEDAIYFDARQWDGASAEYARVLQSELGILINPRREGITESEYPEV